MISLTRCCEPPRCDRSYSYLSPAPRNASQSFPRAAPRTAPGLHPSSGQSQSAHPTSDSARSSGHLPVQYSLRPCIAQLPPVSPSSPPDAGARPFPAAHTTPAPGLRYYSTHPKFTCVQPTSTAAAATHKLSLQIVFTSCALPDTPTPFKLFPFICRIMPPEITLTTAPHAVIQDRAWLRTTKKIT